MDTDEISYKTLRKIQQTEGKSPMLTKIDSYFYNDLLDYMKNLDNRLEKELKSQKQMLLTDEIQNTNKIIRSIYEYREKKILLAAISKARGGRPDLKNLIDAERNLFDSALKLMIQSREQLLEGEQKDKRGKDDKNVETKKEESKIERKDNTNQIVMVTQNIPEFIGTDTKKYTLRAGDIISLPKNMSDMLLKRNVVKEIKRQQS
ncbi:MAG: DNA replication complex GINS family protein [Thermoplasmatales archaeon]|nr:DNA replication complex GINS family protein [Thermoplasmatales archaeon]